MKRFYRFFSVAIISITGCKSTSYTSPWLTPKSALSNAANTSDPISKFDLSAVMGNDFTQAKKDLNQALESRPQDPDLLLRRALLHELAMNKELWLKDMLSVIRITPDAAPAQFALASILKQISHLTAYSEQITSTVEHVLKDGKSSTSIALASWLARVVHKYQGHDDKVTAALQRGGWIQTGHSQGPLAPYLWHSLKHASATTSSAALASVRFAGLDRAPRSTRVRSGNLVLNHNSSAGLFIFESFIEITGKNREIDFQVQSETPHRIAVDGVEIINTEDHDNQQPRYQIVRVKLSPGWHRIRAASLASNNDGLRISVLGKNGETVLAKQSTQANSSNASIEVIGSWPFSESVFSAFAIEQANTKFDALLASSYALVPWNFDLEGSRRILRPIEKVAYDSALYHLSAARLFEQENGPLGRQLVHLRRAKALSPDCPQVLFQIAKRIQSDNPEDALKLADKLKRLAPHVFQADLIRHRIFQARQWLHDSDQAYRDALQKQLPTEVLYSILNHFRARKLENDIERVESRILAQSGAKSAEVKAAFAVYHGQLSVAQEVYVAATQRKDADASSWIRLAKFSLARGRTKAAINQAEQALKLEPRSRAALRIAISANLIVGDETQTKKLIKKSQALPNASLSFEEFIAHRENRLPGLPPKGTKLAELLTLDSRSIAKTPLIPEWKSYGKVRLLDRHVDYLRKDGHVLSMTHFLTRISSKEAADQVGEIGLGKNTIPLTLQTIKPDGRVIEVERHAGKKDLSFAALAPGDTIEKQTVTLGNPRTGDGGYQQIFFFQDRAPNIQSELLVVVPRGIKLEWLAYNGAPEPQIFQDGDTEIYLWRKRNVDAVISEPFAVSTREYLPFVVVSHGISNDSARKANGALYDGAFEHSYYVTHQAEALVDKSDSGMVKLRKLYKWVVNEIKPGNSLNPIETLRNKRGSRIGLLKPMLEAVGLDAELVLTRSNQNFKLKSPYPNLRKHGIMILKVRPETSASPVWVRLSDKMSWFGKVQPDFENSTYIETSDPKFKEHRFKKDEIAKWKTKSRIKLKVDSQLVTRGSLTVHLPAALGLPLRTSLEGLPEKNRTQILSRWIGHLLRGFDATGFEFLGPKDPMVETVLRIKIVAPHFVQQTSDALFIQQFFEELIASKMVGVPALNQYIKLSARKTPLQFQGLNEDMEVEVQFAENVSNPKRAPKSWTRTSEWGTYTQEFSWDESNHTARLLRKADMSSARISAKDFTNLLDLVHELRLRVRDQLVIPTP